MSKFKEIEALSPEQMNALKGAYSYTCEEKKRHMLIICKTDEGKKIGDFKVKFDDVDEFMLYFNGNKKFQLSNVPNLRK